MPPEDKRERADALMRAVEIELAQKRARWNRDREKHRTVRLLSFSFLSLVILAALIALFLMLSRANQIRSDRTLSPHAITSPPPTNP